jgi:glycosyltransferase involved in cell wall biosynthesis
MESATEVSLSMSRPFVSIIIAVKNGERFLRSAIQSVRDTEYEQREIIVVDGKSGDNTRLIARSFPEVRLIEQEGKGLSDAWNVGLGTATGELIAFLDSDDVWAANKLHMQVAFMEEHPEIQYTIGRVKFFLEPGFSAPVGFKRHLLENDHVGRIPGTLLARKNLFDSIGGFDRALVLAGDVDWFARAKDSQASMAVLDEVFLYKRVHDHNLSSNARLNSQELLEIFKKSVDRQRRKTDTNTGGKG